MANKAGSKIICGIMRSKFYPILAPKKIGLNCYRFHHIIATQDAGRSSRRFMRLHKQELLITRFFWRGIKHKVMGNMIAFKLVNPCRSVFGCFSNYSSGPLLSVNTEPEERADDEKQQEPEDHGQPKENCGHARLSELLASNSADSTERSYRPRRNLNEIAFKRKQNIISEDSSSKNPSRLKFGWKISFASYPSTKIGEKYQFVYSRSVESDVVFTDNLSKFDENMKRRLSVLPQPRQPLTRLPLEPSGKYKRVLKYPSDKFLSISDISPLKTARPKQLIKVENESLSIDKERTMQIFRSKKRTSAGFVSGRNENIRQPGQPLKITRESTRAVQVHSLTDRFPKSAHSALQSYITHPSAVERSLYGEHVNPELISSSYSSITCSKFKDLSQKFQLQRDLTSVVTNTKRVPIINRKNLKKSNSVVDNLQFRPLNQSISPDTKEQKHLTLLESQDKTWNFAPKRTRTSTNALNKSHRYALNPAGMSNGQTILKIPKYMLSKDQDTYLHFLTSKSRGSTNTVRT